MIESLGLLLFFGLALFFIIVLYGSLQKHKDILEDLKAQGKTQSEVFEAQQKIKEKYDEEIRHTPDSWDK